MLLAVLAVKLFEGELGAFDAWRGVDFAHRGNDPLAVLPERIALRIT
jgi:hypothetical protein